MDGPSAPGVDGARVTVVVVVYGEEPWLTRSIEAILDSDGVEVELVLVENGGSESVIAAAEADERVHVVRPGRNTGFAVGCNLGVAAGTAPMVALVNPDAIVEPDALRNLCASASDPGIGLATASIRLADRPDRLNCAGNLVTVTGISWADHFGAPADRFRESFDVVGASGAGLAISRSLWDELGGFNEWFFAYWEDTELSIRAIQRGWRVVYAPDAVIVHRYAFSRNPSKFFLLERNRSVTALTCFSRRHLLAIAPLSLAIELGLALMAIRQRWFREKVRAWRWLWSHRRDIAARRREVQSAWSGEESVLLDLLSTSMAPQNMDDGDAPPAFLGRVVDVYWRGARRWVLRR